MSARGSYNTKQKSRILDYLMAHEQQRLTVDDVAQRLMEQGDSVGKTTVYRHLESLSEQGAVHKYVSASGAICYQYMADTSGCEHHSHLVCTDCGGLFHVECDLMHALSGHMKQEHGFELNGEKSILYGRCAECASERGAIDGTADAE
ncbi:transcriptional repressor [Eubacteriales bacterium OttesenSCG-928-N13]|nr:transcriptional repressor [Eubacteriales bacterium OttesenSCG-928-N13]